MKHLRAAALAAAVALAPLGGAVAANVEADNPWRIAQILQKEGYKAELGVTSKGAPKIESAAEGKKFTVFFYGCANGQDCKSIQFSSGFRNKSPITAAKVNEWNLGKRFARAVSTDKGDAFLRMDVNMKNGGVSQATFENSLALWSLLLADFKRHIGWR